MIHCGHPPDAVWRYTPRQIQSFIFIGWMRRKREAAERLSLGTLASRGDPKKIKAQLREWSKG